VSLNIKRKDVSPNRT